MSDKKVKDGKSRDFKEIIQDPKMRAYLFFGFYLIFFVVLIMFIRSGNQGSITSGVTPTPTGSNTPLEEGESIDNYQYIYTVVENGNTVLYMGKHYQNKELFTMLKDGVTSSYYRLNNHFVKKNGEEYLVDVDPYLYSQFYSLDNLDKLLEYNISNESTGNTTIYQVDTIDFFDIYYPSISYDGFSISDVLPDQVEVVKEGDYITKVVFSLNNMIEYYNTYDPTSTKTLEITLEFYDFGKVEDFTI